MVDRAMNLADISFGDRVAENEASKLENYFVKTEPWEKIYSGKADVIFGAKGSGKSALYTLLLARSKDLLARNIILLTAEKPKGKTVFSDITNEPPTSENEFVTLWKIYFCQLIVKYLKEEGACSGRAKIVESKLIEANLIEEENTLKRLVNSAKTFAKNLLNIESVEAGASMDLSITGKITFGTPDKGQRDKGYMSIDELLESLSDYLSNVGKTAWILSDRLDVAFDESLDLEKNALRALFKAYRDIEEYENIRIKIFLRDDIWKRITKDGFREASHITKSTTISWNEKNLLNLIIMRILDNQQICTEYLIDREAVRDDYDKQVKLYYTLFPRQVDVGERQSDTFNWITSRIRDGLGNIAPRELIHYYNEIVVQEKREQDINNNNIEPRNIVSRQAIKNAAKDVSKVRTERTLFAEYPHLKSYVTALENNKAEQSSATLSEVWASSTQDAVTIANELSDIGFFEQKIAKTENIYKIPFLYRFYLDISQGKAF